LTDEPLLIAFDVLATLFVAFGVAYLADEVVGFMTMDRLVVRKDRDVTRVTLRVTTRPLHPLVRAGIILVEIGGIIFFTVLTFQLVVENQPRSPLNLVVNWTALAFEVVAIARAMSRAYLAFRGP
jgi:hypothetical protein